MPRSRAPIGGAHCRPLGKRGHRPVAKREPNEKQADAIVRGVAEEIQRIRLKGGRASRQASCYLDREHHHVDRERGPQHAAIGMILAPRDILLTMIMTATASTHG
jgi:hypothetical protein